ncbi:enoyl-CoA hydratase/isomerase family protein [Pararhodospirillum photometricum]|uniref:3-hydroxyisobutyryl-CoA hydrolase n=1 Tax=Pararhodospirillum photometricum DSM 122 TaxID=1150469 RepID=H6SKZ4_PARPM|nr:enoyl-CoA hydratase/isomerase family protein [Pararhodospirillum photometricum]CCG08659.1 Enoyl-CoA hydratase [Pararhodospirillum photometricum DSM 122]
MTYDEILFTVEKGVARVTLNRPKAHNALTLSKIRHLDPALRVWADDPDVRLVVIEGTGERAFCAGGDVRAMAEAVHDGRFADNEAFFAEEYRLNRLIKTYEKPFIALMDGITMGGGVGISVHGRFRVVTERTVFAMPETGIGMFPDVGGTFFLPRLPGRVGTWLALTGARLKAPDLLALGLATHHIPAERLDELKQALMSSPHPAQVLNHYHVDPGPGVLTNEQRVLIDRCFASDSVEAIVAVLEAQNDPWAQDACETILAKSPTASKITLHQMRLGATLTFDAAMDLEYRIATRITRLPDFYEGVRAVLIDKDNTPRWSPASLEAVASQTVEAVFAP